MKRKSLYVLWLVITFLVFLNIFIWVQVVAQDKGILTVSFLDVGQGDAIFIEAPNGNQMLIDGGKGRAVLKELGKKMAFYDRSIDIVLATHPDKDHIGGLIDVFKRLDVGYIITTSVAGKTKTYDFFEARADVEGAVRVVAKRGMRIFLDKDVFFEVLYPDRCVEGFLPNDASIVGKLIYGDVSFLLTGDISKKIEKYLVTIDGNTLESDVLKLGHHGSKNSSAEIFLGVVSPQYGVVSAGHNNRYGHPHKETIERVVESGITAISTINYGTIVFETDGVGIWRK